MGKVSCEYRTYNSYVRGHGLVTKGHGNSKSGIRHVTQVFVFISAIEFEYDVVYAVRGRFQQTTAKVRSRSGKKKTNFKIDKCKQKSVFQMQFDLIKPVVPVVSLCNV